MTPRCLLRALTFCLQWNDPSILERCSEFLNFPPFYVHQELLGSVAAKAAIAGLCAIKSSSLLQGTGSKRKIKTPKQSKHHNAKVNSGFIYLVRLFPVSKKINRLLAQQT